jgi:hypothetical protein
MLTFCNNSGSQSKATSCEITVVLSCRESSGNWEENANNFPAIQSNKIKNTQESLTGAQDNN